VLVHRVRLQLRDRLGPRAPEHEPRPASTSVSEISASFSRSFLVFSGSEVSGVCGLRLMSVTKFLKSSVPGAPVVRAELADHPTSVPVEALARYVVGAYLALLEWWLASAPEMSPEDADRIFQTLVSPGLRSAMRPAG
jgi:hypothetical protein